MNEKLKTDLHFVSLIIGIVIVIFGAVQSVAVIPYRLNFLEAQKILTEQKISILDSSLNKLDRDLVKISVGVLDLKESIHELKSFLIK